MINATMTERVSITPAAVRLNNGAVTCAIIDTLGFDFATFVLYLGATDIALTVCKLTESDDSGMSGATDVTGGNFATSPATLPSATDDNKFFVWYCNLKGARKRYLQLAITVGNGSLGAYSSAWAELSRASQSPNTAAKRGNGQDLNC